MKKDNHLTNPSCRKKNVAIYFSSLSGIGGGAERQMIRLSQGLIKKGFIIHLITWDNQSAKSFYELPIQVNWHKLGGKKNDVGKLQRFWALFKTLRQNNIHKLIGFVVANNKVVILACMLLRTKIIAAERNGPSLYYIKHSRFSRWANFISLLTSEKIVLQFEDFKSGYPRFLQRKICTIQNIITQKKLPSNKVMPTKKGFQILFLGRLDPVQKQPALLLQAFLNLAKSYPNIRLKIVGDGEASAALQKLKNTSEFGERVILSPSTLNVDKIFDESDLFVIPSLWEGSPNSLIEAMNHGLPAIGFNVDGVRQLIVHNKTGWLIDEINVESLSATIALAISDPKNLSKFSKNAKSYWSSHNNKKIFDEWEKLINF